MPHIWDPPPYPFLKQVLSHCPKAADSYCYIWENRDKNGITTLTKEDMPYFVHKNALMASLKRLSKEGLLRYVEKDGEIFVELVQWEDIEE